MPKKYRGLRKARAAASSTRTADGRPISRLKGPADVLAMVPYLLGFRPHDSLVVVSLDGPRRRFGPIVRTDLLGTAEDRLQAASVLTVVQRHRFRRLLIVALAPERRTADAVVEPLLAALDEAGVEVEEAVYADGRRWWSYLCHDPRCCDPDGTEYDVSTSPAAALAVYEGMTVAPDRDALRGQFGPGRADRRAEVAARVDEIAERLATGAIGGPLDPNEMPMLVRRALRDPGGLKASDVALLALAVRHLGNRDQAWMMITRANARVHLDLWRLMMRQVPDSLLAPVGCLAAFAAWVTGSGVLASHALERVLAVEPAYSMADLLARLLQQAVNPTEWDAVRGVLLAQGGGAAC